MSEVTDEELNAIRRAIYTRYGIDFYNYESKSLKRRIKRVIDNYDLGTTTGLWMKVLREKNFIFTFIDEITVGLTEMFRNYELWILLKNKLLPEYKNKNNFNIWHAGCSTGEEVYTFAILLKETNLQSKANAWATDLNTQSIQKAKEGIFSTVHLKKYNQNYKNYRPDKALSDYYKEINGSAVMKSELKTHVTFEQHNLVSDPVKGNFDIIFCRNVMIYFDKNLQEKLLEKFYNHLNPGGYFIIGYYDANPNAFKNLFELYDAKTKVYRKI